jgi:hypothetical protein
MSRRPSPAMIVAVCALAFAMVGTAVASDGAVSKITKSKVKSIAKKQADKRLKANVSGSHVNLSDKATNADNATNAANAAAVGGQTVTKLFTKIPSGTGATTVYQRNGLTLSVACAGGALQFRATTSVNDSIFFSEGGNNGTAFSLRSSNFDVGDTLNPLAAQSRGNGTITYSTPTGEYVTVTYAADDAATFDTFDGCVIVGSAISG